MTDCAQLSSIGYIRKVHADLYCFSIHMCGIRTKEAFGLVSFYNVYQLGTGYQFNGTLVCCKIILQ